MTDTAHPPTVYVVQDQRRWDTSTGALVPKYPDLAARAAAYGPVRFLLSPSAGPWNATSVLGDLARGLAGFTPQDYLLLIGNPVLIGLATAVAVQVTGGPVRFLQWSGKDGQYIPVEAQVIPRDPAENRARVSGDREAAAS